MNSNAIRGDLVYRSPSHARDARAAFLSRYPNPNTRVLYTRSLDEFFEFCAMCSIDPLEATRAHIELYARTLEIDKGNKASTVNTKLHAVTGFFKYAYIDERIDRDPAIHINKPKVERKTTTNALSRTEMHDFLECTRLTESMQFYALLLLLGYNGLRVGEALQLNVDSFWMHTGFTMITVTRKGGKIDSQPLSNVTSFAIEQAKNGRTTGPMFCKRNGNRMDRRDPGRMIDRVAKRIGITKSLSPHSFRHTFVTLGFNAGASRRMIQAGTGHADPRMLDYYDHGDGGNPATAATHTVTAYVEGAL